MKHLGDITKIDGGKIPVVDIITGGFPLTALRSGIKPLWASEIEAFPIAVTRKHFGDDDAGIEGDVMKYL